MFEIQRLSQPGKWTSVTRNSRSLVAYALTGRVKTDKPLRVINTLKGTIAPTPDTGYLAAWMWLRGFPEPAIERALTHVEAAKALEVEAA